MSDDQKQNSDSMNESESFAAGRQAAMEEKSQNKAQEQANEVTAGSSYSAPEPGTGYTAPTGTGYSAPEPGVGYTAPTGTGYSAPEPGAGYTAPTGTSYSAPEPGAGYAAPTGSNYSEPEPGVGYTAPTGTSYSAPESGTGYTAPTDSSYSAPQETPQTYGNYQNSYGSQNSYGNAQTNGTGYGDSSSGYYSGQPGGQYNYGNQQNGYGNPQGGPAFNNYYQGNNPYGTGNGKSESTGFGIASLVLGILSILCGCMWCASGPLAILAIVFGIIQIVRSDRKGLAIGGIITGGIGIVFTIVFLAIIGSASESGELQKYLEDSGEYGKIYNEIYNDLYNSDDDGF